MRTTIRLDDQLLAELKHLAAVTGRSMTQVITDALREVLSRRRGHAQHPAVRLKTCRGKGLLPGVDLDDSAALRELMDRPDAFA